MQFDNEAKPASQIKINNILYKKDLLTSKKVIYSMTICDTILQKHTVRQSWQNAWVMDCYPIQGEYQYF